MLESLHPCTGIQDLIAHSGVIFTHAFKAELIEDEKTLQQALSKSGLISLDLNFQEEPYEHEMSIPFEVLPPSQLTARLERCGETLASHIIFSCTFASDDACTL